MDAFILLLLAFLTVLFAFVLKLELNRREDLEIKERGYKRSFKYYVEREKRIKDDKSKSK